MTGKKASPVRRRPHRSNDSLSTSRAIKTLKVIYWTQARLAALVRRITSNKREEWFAARVKELRSWPKRTPEQIMEAGSRINPRRLMDGRWSWPKSEVAIQQDRVPPENSIDIDKLRQLLETMDNRTGEKLACHHTWSFPMC